MKYMVIRGTYSAIAGNSDARFGVFDTFEEASENVKQYGGYILKLVEVEEASDES